MSLTKITSAKKIGFGKSALRKRKETTRATLLYMRQKSSFLIAAVSLVAFITGNLVGQHGWYAFMKAALGKTDDSLITYTGTVAPIAYVPDYKAWATYGGKPEEHTYREVPQDILRPLPIYDAANEKTKTVSGVGNDVYSVGYMGSYTTGKEGGGSHPGVDIRVPEGTPVRSIANGVVISVRDDKNGFGKLIVVRYPHMPDPDAPSYESILFGGYAHLSAQLVSEGETVQKGQLIGLSGMSGDATGPHLHFQIDRDSAPWHPFWPFTGAEARTAGISSLQAINTGFHQDIGYKNTVNPVLYTQTNYSPATIAGPVPTNVKTAGTSSRATVVKAAPVSTKSLAQQRRDDRLAAAARIAAQHAAAPVVTTPTTVATTIDQPATLSQPAPTLIEPIAPVKTSSSQTIVGIGIVSARQFTARTWMTLRITLLDIDGNAVTDKKALKDALVLRTAYGEADFDPEILTADDFTNGSATVKMLARGRRTVVPVVQPFNVLGSPILYGGE